jgi:hypothetical protein
MTDEQLTDLATLHLAGANDGDTLDLLPLLRAVQAEERERWRDVVAHAVRELEALDDETAQVQAGSLRHLIDGPNVF